MLDLRSAWGSDPRSLVPWREQLTGRKPLAALAEIRRPPQLSPYVEAYRARYRVDGRDPATWATLVGAPVKTRTRTRPPIAIMVGRHCESACELVARLLQTYANAIVLGSPASSGRLHRDEPALLELPQSKIAVYFYATEYVLSADIEAATGPTGEWNALRLEPVDGDPTAMAVREVERRIARPGWSPSCAGFPSYKSVAKLPPQIRKKISSATDLDDRNCPGEQRIVHVKADVSLATMRKLVASCGVPWVNQDRPGFFSFGNVLGIEQVSRLAQNDWVDEISVSCAPQYEPN